MKDYLTIKHVKGEPMAKDGPGMKVVYPDGYVSWSPQEAFDDCAVEVDAQKAPHLLEALRKIASLAAGS